VLLLTSWMFMGSSPVDTPPLFRTSPRVRPGPVKVDITSCVWLGSSALVAVTGLRNLVRYHSLRGGGCGRRIVEAQTRQVTSR
jgi:hypothetical protein